MFRRSLDVGFKELLRSTDRSQSDAAFDVVWQRVLRAATSWARSGETELYTTMVANFEGNDSQGLEMVLADFDLPDDPSLRGVASIPLDKMELGPTTWVCRNVWGRRKLHIDEYSNVPRAVWHYRENLSTVDRLLTFYRRYAALLSLGGDAFLDDASRLQKVQTGFRTRAAEVFTTVKWLDWPGQASVFYDCWRDVKARPEEPRFNIDIQDAGVDIRVSYDPFVKGLAISEGELAPEFLYHDVILWKLLMRLVKARTLAEREELAELVCERANPYEGSGVVGRSLRPSFLKRYPSYEKEREKWSEENSEFLAAIR